MSQTLEIVDGDEGELRYTVTPEQHRTLMAHGLLAKQTDGTYRLSTEPELMNDPGSAGVNNPRPRAVLSVVRAALSARALPPPEGDVGELAEPEIVASSLGPTLDEVMHTLRPCVRVNEDGLFVAPKDEALSDLLTLAASMQRTISALSRQLPAPTGEVVADPKLKQDLADIDAALRRGASIGNMIVGGELYAAPVVASAKAGWVLVPIEPTEAMIRASLRLDLSYMPYQGGTDRAAVYRAMLAAAPQSPMGEGTVGVAARDVVAERARQMAVEGWTPEHDGEHSDGSLAKVASLYADPAPEIITPGWPAQAKPMPKGWPRSWGERWWKPADRRRNLVKAGALILAEIERLDRAALSPSRQGTGK